MSINIHHHSFPLYIVRVYFHSHVPKLVLDCILMCFFCLRTYQMCWAVLLLKIWLLLLLFITNGAIFGLILHVWSIISMIRFCSLFISLFQCLCLCVRAHCGDERTHAIDFYFGICISLWSFCPTVFVHRTFTSQTKQVMNWNQNRKPVIKLFTSMPIAKILRKH